MLILKNALSRMTAFLEEIDRLKQSEFPYDFPLDALELLEEQFCERKDVLLKTSVNADSSIVSNVCQVSLFALQDYVPLLGFLLRATNVRNAFEAHGTLQRLAEKLMGEKTKLIVSSEWEFSPFVYRGITGLGGFVLIDSFWLRQKERTSENHSRLGFAGPRYGMRYPSLALTLTCHGRDFLDEALPVS